MIYLYSGKIEKIKPHQKNTKEVNYMALDALAIRCLTNELSEMLVGGRIDKIHQPERDEAVLYIRTLNGNVRLVLSASAAHPRLHITASQKSNPAVPPMFCMLMRKHLGSGKITAVRQMEFERIAEIDVESYDELGDLTTKHIIVEIMGRYSNVILTDSSYKIIDAIKHIDMTVSSVRQVLPGFIYEMPPSQGKRALTDEHHMFDFSQKGTRADKVILSEVGGISPLTSREIVHNALGRCDLVCAELTFDDCRRIEQSAEALSEQCRNGEFAPCIITDSTTGRIMDFSSIPIKQYGIAANVKYYKTINETLDIFYTTRDSAERMKQKSAGLVKLLHTNIERASKKLSIQKQTIDDAKNKDRHKIYGELITANLYRINQGDKFAEVENYYEADCPIVKIELSPTLTPSQNAQRYYKLYSKAKTAEVEASKQLTITSAEIDYLESTLTAVENAETESDINAIRTELAEQGYINRRTQNKKQRAQASSKPHHFISSDGFDIYVGRNNTQNDYLTLKYANSSDIWFHTKNIHGSHTIIKLGIDKDVPETTLLEAAQLAAYYSKARSSSQVPVDYTQIKNVKKPNGAKPGMVIYDYYNTVYVTPKECGTKQE